MRTLEQQLDKSLMSERLLASLSSGLRTAGYVLAAIGLYGVMAYMVGAAHARRSAYAWRWAPTAARWSGW
jgi:hypothetical protein